MLIGERHVAVNRLHLRVISAWQAGGETQRLLVQLDSAFVVSVRLKISRQFHYRGDVARIAGPILRIHRDSFLESRASFLRTRRIGAEAKALVDPPLGTQRTVVAPGTIEQITGDMLQCRAVVVLIGAGESRGLNSRIENGLAQFAIELFRQRDFAFGKTGRLLGRSQFTIDAGDGTKQVDCGRRIVGEFAFDTLRAQVEQFAGGNGPTWLIAGDTGIAGAEDVHQEGLRRFGAARLLCRLIRLPCYQGKTRRYRHQQCRYQAGTDAMTAEKLGGQRPGTDPLRVNRSVGPMTRDVGSKCFDRNVTLVGGSRDSLGQNGVEIAPDSVAQCRRSRFAHSLGELRTDQ